MLLSIVLLPYNLFYFLAWSVITVLMRKKKYTHCCRTFTPKIAELSTNRRSCMLPATFWRNAILTWFCFNWRQWVVYFCFVIKLNYFSSRLVTQKYISGWRSACIRLVIVTLLSLTDSQSRYPYVLMKTHNALFFRALLYQ
jgi:hypothetical protein